MDIKIEKINALLQEKSFLSALEKAENNVQVRDLFAANGVEDMTVEDVERMLQESARIHQLGELNEDDLENVAGGILVSTAIVLTVAAAELGFFTAYGYRTIKGWRKK